MIRKFLVFIQKGPIVVVSIIPPLLSFSLLFIWGFLKERYIPAAPQTYTYVCLGVSALLAGGVGLIYIFRKEMPGPVPSVTIKGGWAVFAGVVLTLFFWILGVAIIAYLFKGSN